MKIKSVDIIDCKPNAFGEVVCLRINTDEGLYGYGEVGTSHGKTHDANIGIAHDMARVVLGMNPMNTEKIWEQMFRNTFWGMAGGSVVNAGMSAIDTALWDIKGKALNVPVYMLLGGKTRDRVRAYASQIHFGWDDVHRGRVYPEEYAQAARDAVAQGYTAVKLNPIGVNMEGTWARNIKDPESWKMRGMLSREMLDLCYNRLAAVRDAAPDIDIALDFSGYTDTNTAIQLVNRFKELGIYFVEEATQPHDPALFKQMEQATGVPMATGERLFTRWDFMPLITQRAVSLIQPDVSDVGGITEAKKICDAANTYDIPVQMHISGGPIGLAASLQLEATVPNILIHETHEGSRKIAMRELGKYDYLPKDGYIEFPDLPGIGNELSEKALAEATIYHVE